MGIINRNIFNKILSYGNLCKYYVFWEMLKLLRKVSLVYYSKCFNSLFWKEITNN